MDPTTTHTIGEGGAASWATPDVNTPESARLDPWLPVEVVQVWGDWARVRCENGWETWTDGRALVRAPSGGAAGQLPATGPPVTTADPAPSVGATSWPTTTSGPVDAPSPVAPAAGAWDPQGQPTSPSPAAPAAGAWDPATPPAAGAWGSTPQAPAGDAWAASPGPPVRPGYAVGPGYAPTPRAPVSDQVGVGTPDLWRWLAPAGALLALIGAFLPWLEAGSLSVNSWDIRVLALVKNEAGDGGPWSGWLVLLALVGAACALVRPPGVVVALGGALACVPTGFMILRWMQDEFTGAQLGVGAPTAFVGALLVFAAGCKLTAEDLRPSSA